MDQSNNIGGINITTANLTDLNIVLGMLQRNIVTAQNNRQTALDQFTLGTDQFTQNITQMDAKIAKVQAAITALTSQS
jgi:hypothetical protein